MKIAEVNSPPPRFLREKPAFTKISDWFPVLVSLERLSAAEKRAEKSIVDGDSGDVPLSWGDAGISYE